MRVDNDNLTIFILFKSHFHNIHTYYTYKNMDKSIMRVDRTRMFPSVFRDTFPHRRGAGSRSETECRLASWYICILAHTPHFDQKRGLVSYVCFFK